LELANAGVYDDVAQAAAAWRTHIGTAAGTADPSPVRRSKELQLLARWHSYGDMLSGNESDAVLDNWFRARRRFHDLAHALGVQGRPLPAVRGLPDVGDAAPVAGASPAGSGAGPGPPPNPEAAYALAEEWLETCLPGTEHAVSPHRIRFLQALLSDWLDVP